MIRHGASYPVAFVYVCPVVVEVLPPAREEASASAHVDD